MSRRSRGEPSPILKCPVQSACSARPVVGRVAAGLSEVATFTIPPATRSITIVAEGGADSLYALGVLTAPDGTDLVALPAGPPGPAMRASYDDEQIGQMPGAL